MTDVAPTGLQPKQRLSSSQGAKQPASAAPNPNQGPVNAAFTTEPVQHIQLSAEHERRLLEDLQHEPPPAQDQDLRLLQRLWPFLKPHRSLTVIAMLTIPISTLAVLRQPLATKQAIDGVISEDRSMWTSALMIYGVAVLMQLGASFLQTYCLQLAGQRAMVDLRRKAFEQAERLSISYYDRTPVGRVLTRITNDIDALGELFSSGAALAPADMLMLAGIVTVMLSLDYQLSLVAFAALPPVAWAVQWIRLRARLAFRDIRARVSQLNAYLSEQVQGVQVVQAFGREHVSAAEYRVINDAYRQANHRSIRYDALLFSVVEAVSSVCVAAVLWWASVQAGWLEDERASAAYLGTVAAFYQYLQQFFVPIRDLSTKYTVVQSALAAAERVFAFLDEEPTPAQSTPPAPTPTPAQPEVNLRHDPLIRFRDVRFGYRPEEEVLHGVSFDVQRGEHIAIVGATGAGKTSTIALLLAFYRLQQGSIELGGVNIERLSEQTLRQHIGLVPQDVFLFAGTVGENVTMGPVQDTAAVTRALAQVSALDLLQERGGIHARVEERGVNFSAGERQLIAFARALYRNSEILVLDEATANIDSETEARVQQAIDTLIANRTAIVIAHRLSTIRKADRILVFHRGRIAEEGTHEALLAHGDIYARLYKLQFSGDA